MQKWKYSKQRIQSSKEVYLRIPSGKVKVVKITSWKFARFPNGSLFQCQVIEEDGLPADKFWFVWDYDLAEQLKKVLKGRKPDKAKVKLKVIKEVKEGDEFFSVEVADD
ncbi:MAG: hypothetical protein QXK37_01850 [Candidatus Woesearchaeota archaeon]